MMGRLRRSLPYRLGGVLRRVVPRLPKARVADKPVDDGLTYLTFGGAAHVDMLAESVYSLARSWPALPHLVVAWDGGEPPPRLAKELSFWQGSWEVRPWPQVRALLNPDSDRSLVRFGEREAMARKMAAVVTCARRRPTLYSDVDMLWFRQPASLADWRRLSGPVLAMSRDFQPSYDGRLLAAEAHVLGDEPYFCAGLLYAAGDVLAAAGAGGMLDFAAEAGVGVTEQTIFAEVCRRLGGRCLPLTEIALEDSDRMVLGATFRGRPWAARHYIGQVRHHFWRDALALRVREEDR